MSETCAGKHVCEPDRWPSAMTDTWTCPECARQHLVFRPSEDPFLGRQPGITPEMLGWRWRSDSKT